LAQYIVGTFYFSQGDPRSQDLIDRLSLGMCMGENQRLWVSENIRNHEVFTGTVDAISDFFLSESITHINVGTSSIKQEVNITEAIAQAHQKISELAKKINDIDNKILGDALSKNQLETPAVKIVDNTKLVIALKTAPDDVKTKLFKNMSNRAATLLKEDLDATGPTKISDVEKAQQEIVQQLKDLESKGKALISRGGEGDAFV
jgi:hypothetical protein